MAVGYALQQQGVVDGTKTPADQADSREVHGARFSLLASKPAGTAWNNGDTIYLGKKPEGCKIVGVKGTTDTSLATSTLSVGVGDNPTQGIAVTTANKYVDAKTLTAVNVPTALGPVASTLDDAPGAEEHLWLTVGVANIAAAVLATLEIEMVGID